MNQPTTITWSFPIGHFNVYLSFYSPSAGSPSVQDMDQLIEMMQQFRKNIERSELKTSNETKVP
jgi:hypothetical protein